MEKFNSQAAGNSTTHYVVYVYVDYRKEIGQRMLRSFASKESAIAYAKSLTTDYLAVGLKRKAEKEAKDADEGEKEEEYDDDDYDEDEGGVYKDREIERTCIPGRIFDAYLAKGGKKEICKKHLDLEHQFINRVGVDEVEHFA